MMFNHNTSNWNDWQWQLRNVVTLQQLERVLPADKFKDCRSVDKLFPVKISPYYFELLLAEGGNGALSRMVLPDPAELVSAGFPVDPFGESSGAERGNGVKQRFPDRILVMASSNCAVNCRHCTRKGLLNNTAVTALHQLDQIVEFIKDNPLVREVLISGGDPLMLPDAKVLAFVTAFAALDQIDAVRLCTRMPVTLPMRITEKLADELSGCGKLWVNTQFNHVSEITPDAKLACRRLVEAGIPVSNQSVLLRGVNDSLDEMFRLCCGLQRIRVRPYYVFTCDPIAGIEHFRVERSAALRIEAQLTEKIGGLAMPRFVEDIPGSKCKSALINSFSQLRSNADIS